jgi:ribonuclease Z
MCVPHSFENLKTRIFLSALAVLLSTGVLADGFKVTLLGTGDPIPRVDRFGPSILVQAGDKTLLFDAGRGATQRLVQLGIPISSIDVTFLTHFHWDHLVGFSDVWLAGWIPPWFGQRQTPFRVVGPSGTKKIMDGFRSAYDADIRIRIADERLPPEGIRLETTEFSEDGVVYEEDGVKVSAFAVDHGEYIKPAYGYRVDYNGHAVVMSGDTRFDENLIKAARGTDLLIHEVAAARDELVASDKKFGLILAHHTTPEQAGTVFDRVAPKLAVFSHLTLLAGPGIPEVTLEDLVERTRSNYAGEFLVGEDLMSFEIGEEVIVTPFGK